MMKCKWCRWTARDSKYYHLGRVSECQSTAECGGTMKRPPAATIWSEPPSFLIIIHSLPAQHCTALNCDNKKFMSVACTFIASLVVRAACCHWLTTATSPSSYFIFSLQLLIIFINTEHRDVLHFVVLYNDNIKRHLHTVAVAVAVLLPLSVACHLQLIHIHNLISFIYNVGSYVQHISFIHSLLHREILSHFSAFTSPSSELASSSSSEQYKT